MDGINNSTTIINGKQNGPTVAIFAGVHGNEKVGLFVIDYLKKSLKLKKGTVNLVIANFPAVEKNVRQINKNLNRNIFYHNKILSYEDSLANDLIRILDTSDALLDLHSFNEENNDPFIICEPNSNEIALKLGFKYIVNGMNNISPGSTDGYMYKNNKIGICLELGSSNNYREYIELGIKTVFQFLKQFDLIDETEQIFSKKSQILNVYSIYKRRGNNFNFIKPLKTFDYLEEGFVFATDDKVLLKVEKANSYILFPRQNNPIGVEAFALAEKLM